MCRDIKKYVFIPFSSFLIMKNEYWELENMPKYTVKMTGTELFGKADQIPEMR
jgi:hypothetical protein